MYSFEQIDIDNVDTNEYYGFERKAPFTTIPWLRYLIEDNNAVPVIVRITKNDKLIGYFTGLTVKKFGVKIFGSPFKGWGTCYMGYDLYDYGLIKELLEPTINFIFKKTKCLYIEITERNLNPDDAQYIKYKTEKVVTLEIPLRKSDEDLLKSFKPKCRQLLRQYEGRGATTEIVEPDEGFAEEIYRQICEVFGKQGLVPTYSLDKIKSFIKNLKDSGMLMCITVWGPGGKNIASIIFYGFNKKFFGWCTGSYREFQNLRPNEHMIWFALRHMRDLGYEVFDYAGVAKYKYKWNPKEVEYLRIMAAKYPFLITFRNLAEKAFWILLKIRGLGKKNKVPKTNLYKSEVNYED